MNVRHIFSASRLLVWTGAVLVAASVHAQLVNDGATSTLSNVTNSITGDVTVGTNSAFTLLVLSNNTLLTNSANGFISRNLTARSNEVRLISSTARWRMGGTLYVGSNGANAALIVSNGAFVEAGSASLGFRLESSNNFALISGSGSLWSNRFGLDVGGLGRGNKMIVSNGSWVVSKSARLGVDASSSNNLAIVTGAGSVWSNTTSLSVGNIAPGNRLVIEAGGQVNTDTGVVGDFNSASNNEAFVTGPGSLWINRSSLAIGSQIGRNRLIVSNGAAVWSGQGSIGSLSNQVMVTGASSTWSNQTFLFITGGSNRLDVSNGGWLADATADIAGTRNTITVAGSGSGWNNSDSLLLGNAGNGNTLIASNGPTLLSSNATIGASTGSGNFTLLTGAGTVWSNQNFFTIGTSGAGNQLVVSNGAMLVGGSLITLGTNIGANSNSLVVAGPNSSVTVRSNFPNLGGFTEPTSFIIGATGSWNRVVFSGGVNISGDGSAVLGVSGSSRSNSATVADAGTRWQLGANLRLTGGGFNTLVLSNGAVVSDDYGLIGATTGPNNEVIVTGAGTLWSNRTDCYLGFYSMSNRLTISNGGMMTDITGYIGFDDTASNNEAVVTGPGSVWNNSSDLYLGFSGVRNRLTVADGGLVSFGGNFFTSTSSSGSGNLIVDGGTVRGTNASTAGGLFLPSSVGSVTLNSGLIETDFISLTTGSQFTFNGGRLATRQINGGFLVVGSTGNIPAVLEVIPNAPILINDEFPFSISEATPDPSQLLVSGATGAITKVTVTLSGLTHPQPLDIDMLLVGPFGQRVMLMSDAGLAAKNVTVTIDDAAPDFLAQFAVVTNGAYRPTDYDATDLMADGPPRPYALSLATFNGTDPNGVWSLYIQDDQLDGYRGSLRRWSLEIQTSSGMTTNVSNQPMMTIGGALVIGQDVPGCQLLVTNPAAALAVRGLLLGANPPSTNNRIVVNGTLMVTNASGNGIADIRRGTNVLNAGTMAVDRLLITNRAGQFEFNGGTLRARAITNSNGRVFTVGNGADTATLQLLGGTNVFSNGLTIANHASLISTGSIAGLVVVQPGGTLSSGASIGSLFFNTTPTLQGTTIMKISKDGTTRTNDLIQMPGTDLAYGGALIVSNLGPTALAAGDSFRLFNAAAYLNSFSAISLPPLAAGLAWNNQLLADGSIEVLAQPVFGRISVSGTNVIITGSNGIFASDYLVFTTTNLATPLSNWENIAVYQFDASGNFSFTNPISPGELQRYFRIRTP